MMGRLSRRRCMIFLLFFLLADTLNTDLSTAGPAVWLLCPLAAGLALPVYRIFMDFNRRLGILADILLLLFALWSLGQMVTDFTGLLRTYNDFIRNPALIGLLLLATSFYLSRLHGRGLARTAELFFWPAAAVLLWAFCVGLADCDFGRLLPIDLWGAPQGILWLLVKVFAQGILVLAVLEKEVPQEDLDIAMRSGTLLTGLILCLFLAKDIAQVGWNMASRYSYPLYALAGLNRSGTGMHIEDLLICALLVARLIKGALLLRLIEDILNRQRKE